MGSKPGELPINWLWKASVMRGLGRKTNHSLNSLSVDRDKAKVKQDGAVLRGISISVSPRLGNHVREGRTDREVIEVRPGREGRARLAVSVRTI